ncbi:glycosyltransferase [Olivibacter sitiensis]|uniref:glycosyltransferase n=1 Tax=Olivibacter sitiensis TaxID=376470 RepID=UPI0003F9329F|nr:glycosyltransferase [Olivibacter sitiensis]
MKKILIVSPIACYPSYYGNAARIAHFTSYFKEQGYEVCYLHLPDRAGDFSEMRMRLGNNYILKPYTGRKTVLWRLRLRAIFSLLRGKPHRLVKVDDFLEQGEIDWYKKALNSFQPDCVWVNYTYYSKLFEVTPVHVQKILDTHDCLHLRFKSLYGKGRAMQRYRIDLDDEIAALNRADKVVSIQDEETSFFLAHGCRSPLFTIGYTFDYKPTEPRQKRERILYIGADYSANRDAIAFFLEEIWPELARRVPGVMLYIAGTVGLGLKLDMQIPKGVHIMGVVDDIADLYEQVDVAINPARMGSGLKIKSIEALSYGKPLVTTAMGAAGMALFVNGGLLLAERADEWLYFIVRLLTDDIYYSEKKEAIAEASRIYNDSCLRELNRLLK